MARQALARGARCFILLAAAALCSRQVAAVTTTWRSNGPSRDWLNPQNWTNGVPQAAGDVAVFSNLGSATVQSQLNAPVSLWQLRFTGRGTSEVLGSGSIQFDHPTGSDPMINVSAQGDPGDSLMTTVGVPLAIKDNQTLTIGVQGLARIRLDASISGNGALLYSGQPARHSYIRIGGANTYTGLTTINVGNVAVDAALPSAFGDPSQGTIIRSGLVGLFHGTAEPFEVHRNALLAVNPTAKPQTGKITLIGGRLLVSGPVDMVAPLASEVTIRGLGYVGRASSGTGTPELTAPITGDGLLVFNGTSDPLTTRGAIELRGDVRVAESSNVNIEGRFQPAGDLILDVGISFGRLRLAGDTSQFNGAIETHSGHLTVGTNVRTKYLRLDGRTNLRPFLSSSGVTIEQNGTLDVGALDFFAGGIAGRVTGIDKIVKTTPASGSLSRLDGFDGTIEVREGWLQVQDSGGLGTAAGATRVPVRHGAAIVLAEGRVEEAIHLNNTVGIDYAGGLVSGAGELAGTLHLGDQGSYVGGRADEASGVMRGDSLRISGSIHGGSLFKVEASTDLIITGAGHTYTGQTEILGGNLTLTGGGRLASTSQVLVGGGRVSHSGNPNSTLRIDDRGSMRSQDRLADHVHVSLNSGRIELVGIDPAQSSETIGRVMLEGGYNRIWSTAATLRIDELVRQRGSVGVFLPAEAGRVDITNAVLDDGIVGGWALFAREDYRPQAFATVGPSGVVAAQPVTQWLNASAADQNVMPLPHESLDQDVTVNSIHSQGTSIDLNGHRLTIDSGGLLVLESTTIKNGQITAGTNRPGELIIHNYHGIDLGASVVDNGTGPVTLHIAGNFAVPLHAANTYTGGTIVSRGSQLQIQSRQAVPADDVVTLNSGQYHIDFADGMPLQLKRMVMRGGSLITGTGQTAIDAETYEMYSGFIGKPLTGDGMLIKRGEGIVELNAPSPNFVGPIVIEQGTLEINENGSIGGTATNEDQAITVLGDGVLFIDGLSTQRLINLKGGKVLGRSFGSNAEGQLLRAPIEVNGTGTVQTTPNSYVYLDGRIFGHGDLILHGSFSGGIRVMTDFDELDGDVILTGQSVSIEADNSGFQGKTIIRAARTEALHRLAIGPGGAVIEREGVLRSGVDLDAPLTLTGGVFVSDTSSVTLFGNLNVTADSRIDTPDNPSGTLIPRNLTVFGGVTLADSVRLKKSGPGALRLYGPLHVGASTELIAWEGTVEIDGQVEATSPTSVLNMKGNDNFTFAASVNVPAGRSFQLLQDGESADLRFSTPNLRLTGSGSIIGDIEVDAGALIAPGANYGMGTGALSTNGSVVLGDGAVVELGIGGLIAGSQHDQLQASGSIQLGGDLNIALINPGGGFQLPNVGDEYTIMSAPGGITESIKNAASLSSIGGGSFVDWALQQEQNRLILKAMAVTQLLGGDYNADGQVDTADFVLWRNSIGGVNLAADGNRDGQIDQLDYQVWRAHFGEVAPVAASRSTLSDTAVPEPPTAILLLIIAAIVQWRHSESRRKDNVV